MSYKDIITYLERFGVPYRIQDGRIQVLDPSLLPWGLRSSFDNSWCLEYPEEQSHASRIFEQAGEPSEAQPGDFWIQP